MWLREPGPRIAARLATLPVLLEVGRVRLARSLFVSLRGRSRKILAAGLWLGLIGVLAMAHQAKAEELLVAVGSIPILVRLGGWLARHRRRNRILDSQFNVEGLPPAQVTLLTLGVGDAVADRLATAGTAGEVRLATYDDDNRVLSHIGPIPYFAGELVPPEQFRERLRHRLELVVARGVVCVKKTYRDRASFEGELLALHAIAGLSGVPQIVAVHRGSWTLYQSFVPGRNLGTLMIPHGATISVQHRVSVVFSHGAVASGASKPARETALGALGAVVPPEFVSRLADLLERIHERGVTVGDIKYGNVLVAGDQPGLCDFDHATVFSRNNWRCILGRATERDKFNFFFDGEMLSERRYLAAAARLLRQRPDLFSGRIHYGHGQLSPPRGSLASGSAQWRLLRRHLPDLAGKSVVDLSCRTGVMALEMLRAGARSVIAFERDPVMAQYARLNHEWLEVVQNRRYHEFHLVEGTPAGAWDGVAGTCDLAVDFHGFEGMGPKEGARVVAMLSQKAESLIVRAARRRDTEAAPQGGQWALRDLQDLLQANGYRVEQVIDSLLEAQPLLIGRRSGILRARG